MFLLILVQTFFIVPETLLLRAVHQILISKTTTFTYSQLFNFPNRKLFRIFKLCFHLFYLVFSQIFHSVCMWLDFYRLLFLESASEGSQRRIIYLWYHLIYLSEDFLSHFRKNLLAFLLSVSGQLVFSSVQELLSGYSWVFVLVSTPNPPLDCKCLEKIRVLLILPCSSYDQMKVLVAQSCPTLCGPMDYSPPGSYVHGILQAKILE